MSLLLSPVSLLLIQLLLLPLPALLPWIPRHLLVLLPPPLLARVSGGQTAAAEAAAAAAVAAAVPVAIAVEVVVVAAALQPKQPRVEAKLPSQPIVHLWGGGGEGGGGHQLRPGARHKNGRLRKGEETEGGAPIVVFVLSTVEVIEL